MKSVLDILFKLLRKILKNPKDWKIRSSNDNNNTFLTVSKNSIKFYFRPFNGTQNVYTSDFLRMGRKIKKIYNLFILLLALMENELRATEINICKFVNKFSRSALHFKNRQVNVRKISKSWGCAWIKCSCIATDFSKNE